MTLVAAYRYQGTPYVIGDAMLSIAHRLDSKAYLPSVGSDQYDAGLLTPVGLTQKLVLISDKLLFCYAGAYGAALNIVNELRSASERAEIRTELDLREVIGSISGLFDELEGAYALLHEGGEFLELAIKTVPYAYAGHDLVHTLGSGQAAFLNHLDVLEGVTQEYEGHSNFPGPGVGKALSFAAASYFSQAGGGVGIKEGWGAAFEVAYLGREKIEKVDQVLYVIFMSLGSCSAEQILRQSPPIFYYNTYFNASLGCFTVNPSGPPRFVEIPPPGLQSAIQDFPARDLKIKWMITVLYFSDTEEIVTESQYDPGGEIGRLSLQGREMSISISEAELKAPLQRLLDMDARS